MQHHTIRVSTTVQLPESRSYRIELDWNDSDVQIFHIAAQLNDALATGYTIVRAGINSSTISLNGVLHSNHESEVNSFEISVEAQGMVAGSSLQLLNVRLIPTLGTQSSSFR